MHCLGLFWLLTCAVFYIAHTAPISEDPDSASAYVGRPGRGGRRVGGMSGGPSGGGAYKTPKETADYLRNLRRYDKLMNQYVSLYDSKAST